ncbi:MAG: Swt1 family HEPN domain-containing protein [Syntrophorhabdaceae bacterium]|nr:Swt1 family HEPN domain-containing protein [Syntrophorhabdaceae bacterium]
MHSTMSQMLWEATGILQDFLLQILPSLSRNWWNDLVLRYLTPQQQQSAKEKNVKSLSGLDLKALLRVLERNWSPIRGVKQIPYNALHYVKEMSEVRNRWAHMTTEEVPPDDIYRDLDTLQRFASAIEAGPEYINNIKKAKEGVFPKLMPSDLTSKGKIETVPTPSSPPGRTVGKSTRRVVHASRRPRDPQMEASLKGGKGTLQGKQVTS